MAEEKHGDEDSAAETFKQVVERDAGSTPALIKLAWHSYRTADLPAAEEFIRRALARNRADPQVQYAAGVVYRAGERWPAAKDAFWATIHYGGALTPALADWVRFPFASATTTRRCDIFTTPWHTSRTTLLPELTSRWRCVSPGVPPRLKAVDAAREAMPLLPYVLAEAWRGANQDASRALGGRNAWNKPLPPDVEYYLEIAAWYLRLGDRLSANSVCVSRTINCHPANIRRSSTTTWLISLGGRGRGSERTT